MNNAIADSTEPTVNTNDKIMLNVTIALLITIGHSGCSIVPLTLGKVDSTKSSILYANQRIADSLKGLHTATQEECEAAQIANAEESSRQEERRVAHLHALRSERYRARDELQESVKETLRSDLNLAMYQQLQLGEMTVDADEVSRIALQRKDDLATR
ncbi:MAG: hypothetical protein HOL01_25220 [Planctomycetaceae bacterium]|nr:hypothetical protein [Planctomycetaceae bacterium]MBT6497827.1 hypothetical protein [Planctomycetaceae bacterium]